MLQNPVSLSQTKATSTIDDILDKLSKNNYDRSCLTQSELNILKNHS